MRPIEFTYSMFWRWILTCKCIILPYPHRAEICRPIRAQIEQLVFAESVIGTVLQTVHPGCPDERPFPRGLGEMV